MLTVYYYKRARKLRLVDADFAWMQDAPRVMSHGPERRALIARMFFETFWEYTKEHWSCPAIPNESVPVRKKVHPFLRALLKLTDGDHLQS